MRRLLKRHSSRLDVFMAASLALFTAACGGGSSDNAEEAQGNSDNNREQANFIWPEGLNAFGDGYPEAGDPCRRLGESALTIDYLDHTAVLVGCPGGRASKEAADLIETENAEVVAEVEGVTLLSIPANAE